MRDTPAPLNGVLAFALLRNVQSRYAPFPRSALSVVGPTQGGQPLSTLPPWLDIVVWIQFALTGELARRTRGNSRSCAVCRSARTRLCVAELSILPPLSRVSG